MCNTKFINILLLLVGLFVAVSDETEIPLDSSHWKIVYDGFGQVALRPHNATLIPKAATQSSETHAALVISKVTAVNFNATIRARTVRQLRQNNPPNSWSFMRTYFLWTHSNREVFWPFFNYVTVPLTGKKETNDFLLRTNGFELGVCWGEADQDFLVTGDHPAQTIGTVYEYGVVKRGTTVDISVNGSPVVHYKDDGIHHPLFQGRGSLGLYCEDSHVEVEYVDFTPLD